MTIPENQNIEIHKRTVAEHRQAFRAAYKKLQGQERLDFINGPENKSPWEDVGRKFKYLDVSNAEVIATVKATFSDGGLKYDHPVTGKPMWMPRFAVEFLD